MTKIKPWEKIPKKHSDPTGAYITRVGDSEWAIDPYEHGFIVGRIRTSKGWTKVDTDQAKYPTTLEALQRVVAGLGHVLDGRVVPGLDEAVQGTLRASLIAADLSVQIKEVVQSAARYSS